MFSLHVVCLRRGFFLLRSTERSASSFTYLHADVVPLVLCTQPTRLACTFAVHGYRVLCVNYIIFMITNSLFEFMEKCSWHPFNCTTLSIHIIISIRGICVIRIEVKRKPILKLTSIKKSSFFSAKEAEKGLLRIRVRIRRTVLTISNKYVQSFTHFICQYSISVNEKLFSRF